MFGKALLSILQSASRLTLEALYQHLVPRAKLEPLHHYHSASKKMTFQHLLKRPEPLGQ